MKTLKLKKRYVSIFDTKANGKILRSLRHKIVVTQNMLDTLNVNDSTSYEGRLHDYLTEHFDYLTQYKKDVLKKLKDSHKYGVYKLPTEKILKSTLKNISRKYKRDLQRSFK